MEFNSVLTTDWNRIRSIEDFWLEWPSFSADVGISSFADIWARPSCDGGISDLDDINGLNGYFPPAGRYIRQLDAAGELLDNSLFLVSRIGTEVSSASFSYRNLLSRLSADVMAGLGLGDMAYRSKEEFALSGHSHDDLYSRVNIFVNPKYDPSSPYYAGNTSDACSCWLSSGGRTKTVVLRYPAMEQSMPPKPAIGTLRFVGAPTIRRLADANMLSVIDRVGGMVQVNPYDEMKNVRDDYDGWVFANGVVMSNIRSQLSDAALLYGQSGSSDFTLPSLGNFFKMNPGTVSEPLTVKPSQTGLKRHRHDTLVHDFTGSLTLDKTRTEMYSTDWNGGGYRVHQGDAGRASVKKIVEAPMTIDFNQSVLQDLSTTKCAAIGSEPSPRHQLVPVMVYIGGETDAYYENLYSE